MGASPIGSNDDLDRAVRGYVAAWNCPDLDARRQLLTECFATDGTYTDPAAHVAGREALVRHTRLFAQRWPDAVIELTSGIDIRAGRACFTWRLAEPDGRILRDGIDFLAFDADGQVCEVQGFFGAYRSPHPR